MAKTTIIMHNVSFMSDEFSKRMERMRDEFVQERRKAGEHRVLFVEIKMETWKGEDHA